ncbi:MAG: PVC-type heme-binding CxxCH protein, partial [Planctomycetota bacterium]
MSRTFASTAALNPIVEGCESWLRLALASLFCFVLGGSVAHAGDPNAEKLERIPSPEESLAAMTVAEGYEIQLFASEVSAPLFNPMSMAFDAEGRLWVITSPTYPHYDPGVPPSDKILIFEDTDGDGVADRHTIFADQLYIPTGILPDVNGGCWVGQQPNLWYMQDTDGDLVADRREVVLHGFGTEDSHHSISAFTWGPDGAFYFNEGVFHHTQVETPYGPIRARDAAVFRYHPGRQRFTVSSHRRYNNPWGHAFDRWGQSVLSDASGGRHFNFAHVIPA